MRYICRSLALLLLAVSALHVPAQEVGSSPMLMPLAFEKNVGQAPREAVYVGRSGEGKIVLEKQAIVTTVRSNAGTAAMRMAFAGSSAGAQVSAETAAGGVVNYYGGSKGSRWLEGIPLYERVRYRAIYPDTDLVFHGRDGRLEYDFELAPNADPERIVLEFTGVESVSVESDGALLLSCGGNMLRMLAPEAYQQSPRATVHAAYRLLGNKRVGFSVGEYDRSRSLVIDPVVAYTKIIGVNNHTTVEAMTGDSAGNVFVVGRTIATDYPVTIGSSNSGLQDAAYLTKLDSTGKIVFSTELQSGTAADVALASSGSIFMAGIATGQGFPVTSNSFGTCDSSCYAGFAAKFDGTGHLQYSTLLAPTGVLPKSIAVDSAGSAYLTGDDYSGVLPTVNAFQPTFEGMICTSCYNAFFAKLNTSGTGYEFASYFGSSDGGSIGQKIALDASGNIYLSGKRSGTVTSVPLMNPLQSLTGGLFLAKFASDGKTLLFSTLFGGGGDESVAGMAIGSDGTLYLAGNTSSQDFPYTLNAYRFPTSSLRYGDSNMFAAAFKPDLSGFKYSTYLGTGHANAMVLIGTQVYVAGSFGPEQLPLKNAVVADLSTGGFVLSLDSTGGLMRATQFGGLVKSQVPTALAVDGGGNIYVAGIPESNSSSDYGELVDPVNVGTGAAYLAQEALGPSASFVGYTTFLAKIAPTNAPQISLSVYQPFLVLRNAGSADLHIQSITLGNNLANKHGNCGATLPAGTSCVLTVTDTFGKVRAGGTVTINSDASPASQTFTPAVGTFTPGPLLWPDRALLWFGPQQRGTASPTQSFRLWNVGATPAEITSIGSSATTAQANDCPSSLDPGKYCTFQVSLTPDSLGAIGYGSVSIQSSQGNVGVSAMSAASDSALLLSTDSINFGGQHVGTAGFYRTVTVTNASNATVTSPTAAIQGGSQFTVSGTTCASSLAPRQSCVVAIAFTPDSNGQFQGTLNITSGNATAKTLLAGTGLLDSAVTVSPLEWKFSYAIVGRASYAKDFTLTNTAANPVKVTGISFSLPDFSQTNTCQNAIPASGTCSVSVSVKPQQVGDRIATMTITFDSAGSQSVSLLAQAITPMTSDVTALDFGSLTPVGADSDPQYVNIRNASYSASQSYTMDVTGDFRLLATTCPNPMPATVGCGFGVVFHPTQAGPRQGALTVSFPDTTAKFVVALAGTAASAGATVSPIGLEFGSVMATTSSAAKSVTITNPQTFAVTVPRPVLSGTAAAEYQVTFNCVTLQPGDSCQVPVVFSPTATGTRSATLTFQNGGTPATAIPISLTGIGTAAPGLSLKITSYDFGNADVGASTAPFLLTISNDGPRATALPTLTIGGQNPADFTVTPDSNCSNIPSHGSCQVTVVFKPAAGGPRGASISLPSGGTDSQTLTFYPRGFGADFTLPSDPGVLTASVTTGQTAQYLIITNPVGVYSRTVSVTCAPANSSSYGTCTVDPNVLDYAQGGTALKVAIAPATQGALPHTSKPLGGGWLYAFATMLPLGLLLQRRVVSRHAVVVLIVLVAAIGFVSCGGGGGGGSTYTPPPTPTTTTYTYTLTLHGAGTYTRSVNLTLLVTSK